MNISFRLKSIPLSQRISSSSPQQNDEEQKSFYLQGNSPFQNERQTAGFQRRNIFSIKSKQCPLQVTNLTSMKSKSESNPQQKIFKETETYKPIFIMPRKSKPKVELVLKIRQIDIKSKLDEFESIQNLIPSNNFEGSSKQIGSVLQPISKIQFEEQKDSYENYLSSHRIDKKGRESNVNYLQELKNRESKDISKQINNKQDDSKWTQTQVNSSLPENRFSKELTDAFEEQWAEDCMKSKYELFQNQRKSPFERKIERKRISSANSMLKAYSLLKRKKQLLFMMWNHSKNNQITFQNESNIEFQQLRGSSKKNITLKKAQFEETQINFIGRKFKPTQKVKLDSCILDYQDQKEDEEEIFNLSPFKSLHSKNKFMISPSNEKFGQKRIGSLNDSFNRRISDLGFQSQYVFI